MKKITHRTLRIKILNSAWLHVKFKTQKVTPRENSGSQWAQGLDRASWRRNVLERKLWGLEIFEDCQCQAEELLYFYSLFCRHQRVTEEYGAGEGHDELWIFEKLLWDIIWNMGEGCGNARWDIARRLCHSTSETS